MMALRFLLLLSVLSLGSTLDIPTMKSLIQKEFDSLRSFDPLVSMELLAPNATMCFDTGCANETDQIHAALERFAIFSSMSVETNRLQTCYFLPEVNKAACSMAVHGVLKSNPGCVTDGFHGVVEFEWNEEGKIVRLDNFFKDADVKKAVGDCTPPK